MQTNLKTLCEDINLSYTDRKFKEISKRISPDDHDLLRTLLKNNLSYRDGLSMYWNSRVIERAKQALDTLNALRTRQTPQIGHCILLDSESGYRCDAGHIGDVYRLFEKGEMSVTLNASVHFTPSYLGERGIDCSHPSGGPALRFNPAYLKPHDEINRTFWFWGEGACGQGGIYITAPMKRWKLDPQGLIKI
jgi:hypothetical protein